jgi:competence protein ComFC
MENLAYFIDINKSIKKQLHPSYLVKSNNKYLLILPYYGYNSYSDFKLIRLSDLSEINLYKILPFEVIEHFNELDFQEFFFASQEHQFLNNDFLFIGDYVFSCDNLFENSSNLFDKHQPQELNLKSLIPIKNIFFEGFAIEIHTLKSTLLANGRFETTRTDLGELLFRLKYKFDRSSIEEIATKCSTAIQSAYSDIDVIIPTPPSNLERPFQPVYEVAKRISEITDIPIDLNYIIKLPTEQIKSLNIQEDRNIILDRSISIGDDRYKNKNVLIFDDLYRSGDTLSAISRKLLSQGKVNIVKVLCITKTRTKR